MTLMVSGYTSKKELKASIGKSLNYIETSAFGPEYKENGKFAVAHRPAISHEKGREFFAEVTMKDGKILKVE